MNDLLYIGLIVACILLANLLLHVCDLILRKDE
jgi:hypothetical protein